MTSLTLRLLILSALFASSLLLRPGTATAQPADLGTDPGLDSRFEQGAALESELEPELTEPIDREQRARMEAAAELGADAPGEIEPVALPSGEAKSAVEPSRVSLPATEGSVEGMGESFTPHLSSGTGTFSVPIALPGGRNGVQPSLGLAYSTGGGNGDVGFGWGLGVPFIARQSDRGLPRYLDGAAWTEEEDRFVYNGGSELVPVDSAGMAEVDASGLGYDAAGVPEDVRGWQQYRARIEGGFMRFFRSPDARQWVVQSPDGTRFDFGALSFGDGPADIDTRLSLVSERPDGAGRIGRWLLTRTSDANGSTIYYRYARSAGHHTLRDIFYVSPASCGSTAGDLVEAADAQRRCREPLSDYAVRVSVRYEPRDDVFTRYVLGWAETIGARVREVRVTAAQDVVGQRYLVRRYHLRYDPSSYHALLASVQVEGRPETMDPHANVPAFELLAEDAVPAGTGSGRTLPPMQFHYTQGPAGGPAGFHAFDPTVHAVTDSPDVSVDEARADLFDVNSDGLADLIVTDPARYRTAGGQPAVGVYFNGFAGTAADPAGHAAIFSAPVMVPMPPALAGSLALGNANIVPMDADGDGRSDLLHMPRRDTYGYFTAARGNPDPNAIQPTEQDWRFVYAQVELDGAADPRLDWLRDGGRTKVMDVNGDHLIDVVQTTGTAMRTWLNLGWLAGGEGRFGSATFDGDTWTLSTAPIETCLLHDGRPLDFSDPDVRVADMNGDGIQDLVRLARGQLRYWPGRGLSDRGGALFGVGPSSCGRGEGEGREIEMTSAPTELNPDLGGVFVTDVNADGASDLVQVRFDELDVWFNRGGSSFTSRVTLSVPMAPGFAPRVRFTDIDGSGTTDLVYANAGGWVYLDLLGGQRPRLLTEVENGLGASTELEYESSAVDYLLDLQDATECPGCETFAWQRDGRTDSAMAGGGGGSCDGDAQLYERSGECVYRSSGSPVISTVVRAMRTRDHFDLLGREENVVETRYAYHDGYYEGIEQEFRGFGAADAVAVGDADHPTQYTRTWFHQGRRPDAIASDRLADNPREALKGRTYLTESFDETNVFLSSAHASTAVRRLATGLDGRGVWFTYGFRTDELRYDTAPFEPGGGALELPRVRFEAVVGGGIPEGGDVEMGDLPVRGSRWAWIGGSTDAVDNLGQVLQSTAHGRLKGEDDDAPRSYDEAIVSHASHTVRNERGQWIRLGTSGFVTGHGAAGRLSETETDYDALGRVVATRAYAGTDGAAYDFGALTLTDQVLESSSRYDGWGNARVVCSGADLRGAAATECLRYAEIDFEETYHQLAQSERTALDGSSASYCAGTSPFCMLEASATFDRGLGAALSSTDANGLQSRVVLDGVGRPTASFVPAVNGCPANVPSVRISYDLAEAGRPVSVVQTEQLLDCEDASATITARSYTDGAGRPRASLTRAGAVRWEQSGLARFTARGTSREVKTIPEWIDSPTYVSAVAWSVQPSTRVRYDAFGRPRHAFAEDGSRSEVRYHALSSDACDALDLGTNPQFAGTCATERTDGHGRTIDAVQRQRRYGGGDEVHRLLTTYRADGHPLTITRAETASGAVGASVVDGHSSTRTFTYDSAGRRLGSTDPDTDNLGAPAGAQTWRYLFNRVGDLAAVRDPRGCGQDFYYDRAGRLLGERYVGCAEAMAVEETPDESVPAGSVGLEVLASAVPVDVRSVYDQRPDWAATFGAPASFDLGRAVAVSDRGQRSVLAVDGRGQPVWEARQMALPNLAPDVPVRLTSAELFDAEPVAPRVRRFDEAHTYLSTTTYDHASRVVSRTLPTDPDWETLGGAGAAPAVAGAITYDVLGLPLTMAVDIGGVRHGIVDAIDYTRQRSPSRVQYGDGTVSTFAYDVRQRPRTARTMRAATGASGLSAVTTACAHSYTWDAANNLVGRTDERNPSEWGPGFRPRAEMIGHDALYRVSNLDVAYREPDWRWSSVDASTDWRDTRAAEGAADPMRRRPAPMAPSLPDERVVNFAYEWDWLANQTEWTDDAQNFYERSLGEGLGNGFGETVDGAPARPSALYFASNVRRSGGFDAAADRGGYLRVRYGVSGNAETLTVRAQCRDRSASSVCVDPGAGSFDAREAALDSGCVCASEQHTQYRWDELNRLAEARRYDRHSAGPVDGADWILQVRQRMRYDGANVRTVKQTLDGYGGASVQERAALYVLPGDFERRGLLIGTDRYRASTALGTESQYLVGGARIVHKPASETAPGAFARDARITYAITDLLQSTSSVVDLRSGELLEHTTFHPSGARETHIVNEDVENFATEPNGFTGKEADEEVGLVYFGERYLIPRLGRWASPDPLHVHAVGGGEALNSYHYVAGNLLQARDPDGLRLVGAATTIADGTGANPPATVSADDSTEMFEQDMRSGLTTRESGFIGREGNEFYLTESGHEALASIQNGMLTVGQDVSLHAANWLRMIASSVIFEAHALPLMEDGPSGNNWETTRYLTAATAQNPVTFSIETHPAAGSGLAQIPNRPSSIELSARSQVWGSTPVPGTFNAPADANRAFFYATSRPGHMSARVVARLSALTGLSSNAAHAALERRQSLAAVHEPQVHSARAAMGLPFRHGAPGVNQNDQMLRRSLARTPDREIAEFIEDTFSMGL